MKTKSLIILVALLIFRAEAQTVLFDFENAPRYTSLPINLTVGGITAHFSASGQGFSIQLVTVQGINPGGGFAGNCIYPNSVYAADLLVSFSKPLTAFSILYATQELACDDSATMRVTAYMNGTPVGTSTANSTPLCTCTYQANTLSITTTQAFNSVVVHYDAKPPTCQDWGPVFLADNMIVTPMPPILLTTPTKLTNAAFQFTFTNTPNYPFTVLGTTNLSLPFSNWTTLTGLTEAPPGQFQFTDSHATNIPSRFYRVTSP